MSPTSPPATPQQRLRPLQQRAQAHNDRLQIRAVPYSPPRLSGDGLGSGSGSGSAPGSNRVSYADNSPAVPPHMDIESDDLSFLDDIDEGNWTSWVQTGSVSPQVGSSGPSQPRAALRINDQNEFVNAPSPPMQHGHQEQGSPPSSSSSTHSFTSQRTRRMVTLHPGTKTFTLLPSPGPTSSRTDSGNATFFSTTTPSSSYGRVSSVFDDQNTSRPASPSRRRRLTADSILSVSSVPDQSFQTASSSSRSGSGSAFRPRPRSPSSPWNYRMTGGLRKVSKPADFPKDRSVSASTRGPSAEPAPLPTLAEVALVDPSAALALATKASFQSTESNSTLSERTNYKIYGQSSPVHAPTSIADAESCPPSSSHSQANYRILAESSTEDLSQYEYDSQRPPTARSDVNYTTYGPSSAAASTSSLVTTRTKPRSQYSRESLVVAPLRPVRQQRSFDRSSSYQITKSRSRDSLRSLTSISSILTQEATRALFSHPQPGSIHITDYRRQNSWAAVPNASQYQSQMISHPHQWSSQLSTVVSESEGGSLPPSRSISPLSNSSAFPRRGSGVLSTASRHMRSISSSLAGPDDLYRHSSLSQSGSGPLSSPALALSRHTSRDPSSSNLLIADYDEHGDGLAELGQLHHRSSRSRISNGPSGQPLERNLGSSGTSRSNSLRTFTASIPTWAQFYYGGEGRRLLFPQASTESMRSLFKGPAPRGPAPRPERRQSRTPSVDRFVGAIYGSRRRPRETSSVRDDEAEIAGPYQPSLRHYESIESMPAVAPPPPVRSSRPFKRQTSSVWSPHLARDQRASRYSMWEPPSAIWSAESGPTGRRNLQIILFVVGFVCPFAWMVASFLPLPHEPRQEMMEQDVSTSHIDLGFQSSHAGHAAAISRYHSAMWWRNLNRGMSILGLLIIGAIIALVVVGVRQQWGS